MKEEYDFTKDKTFDVYTIEELLEQYRDNDYYNLSKTENITKLLEEIERLEEELEKTRLSELDKEYRIDKTIEYIENYLCSDEYIQSDINSIANAFVKLVDILKGVNKE